MDEMRRQCIQEKGYTVVELWECERWKLYKTDVSVKELLKESFPYKRPLRQDQLLDNIKSKFQSISEKVPKFPPIFKSTNVCRQVIGPLMQEYAEEGLMSQRRRMLFSSLELTSGTIITPLLLFYLELGLVCTKTYRFVDYTCEML